METEAPKPRYSENPTKIFYPEGFLHSPPPKKKKRNMEGIKRMSATVSEKSRKGNKSTLEGLELEKPYT